MKKTKKILIIGCSFSSGAYTLNFNDTLNPETCDYSYGWYDELPKDGYEYTVYSNDGGGYLQYADIVKDDRPNLKQFDMILIQETFEPRLSIDLLSKEPVYETKRNYNSVILKKHDVDNRIYTYGWRSMVNDHISRKNKNLYGLEPNESMDRWLDALRNDGRHVHLIYRAMPAYVDQMLRDDGIPTYAYSTTGVRYKHKHIQYIDAVPAIDDLFFDLRYHNFVGDRPYHLNHDGTRLMGIRIRDALKDIL